MEPVDNHYLPRVSVIMLAFNREQYIREAIDSVLNQTFTDLELIIVDDGSADSTPEIIRSYNDPRITSLFQVHTGHGSKLRNLAFSKCRGDLVALLDSDDVWLPTKVEKQVKLMDQNRAGFTFCDVIEFSKEGVSKNGIYRYPGNSYREENIFAQYVNSRLAIYPSTVMFRKAVCGSDRPWNEAFKWTDNELLHRIAFRYPAGIIPERLVKIRKHGLNHSEIHPEEAIVNMIPMLDSFRESKMISSGTHRSMTSYYHYLSGLVNLRGGRNPEARRAFLQSLQSNPFHLKAWYRWSVGQLAKLTSGDEQQQRMKNWFGRWIGPGSLCFDIGGHRGLYTSVFLKLGARVITLEPVSESAAHITREYSTSKDLTVLRKAVSDRPGVLKIFVSDLPEISTVSTEFKDFYGTHYDRRWPSEEEVPSTTLDELIQTYGTPDFIKIDVEGHELRVLEGLSRSVNTLSFEFNFPFREQAMRCVERLASIGFTHFNYSAFENFMWESGNWLNENQMTAVLRGISPDCLTGDIYATRTPS